MKDIGPKEVQMFELFAAACERLIEYGIKLRASGRFFDVRNGAGTRNYQSGWRLEKWIEADINKGGVAGGASARSGGWSWDRAIRPASCWRLLCLSILTIVISACLQGPP